MPDELHPSADAAAASGSGRNRPGHDVDAIGSALIRQLHSYWDGKRNGRLLPRKSDIDPADIKPMLPFLLLADYATDPFRLRYRLVGTEVVSIYGMNFTGRWLHELDFGDQVEGGWTQLYKAVFDSGRPIFGAARLLAVSGIEMDYEFGLFPLSDNGTTPTHCMDFNDYRPHLRHTAESWTQLQLRQRAGR